MAHPYAEHRTEERARAGSVMSRCGYADGGAVSDRKQDAAMVARGVHEHESHMHKGEPKTKVKLRHGGSVDGQEAKQHLAKRARGGRTGKHTKVNVIVMPQGGGGMGGARPVPVPVPARPPMAAAPPPAAAPAPPPGAMPVGMGARPPMPPMGGGAPMMRARGGKVPHMEAGAASGPGRIEKTHEYGEGGFKPKMRGVPKKGRG